MSSARAWLLASSLASLACGPRAAPGLTARLASPAPPAASAPDDDDDPTQPPDAPPAEGLKRLTGFLASGGRRPSVQTLPFDVDELPVADWSGPTAGAGFNLRGVPDGWTLRIRSHVFAEVVVATTPIHGSRVVFTAFTGGSFSRGDVPKCGPGVSGTLMAMWSGFSPDGWTRAGMDVEMGIGDFDLTTCSATPRRSLHGRAAAIVPGFVYALRTRDEDSGASEKLVVLLPRGAFVSTGADPMAPIDASNTGSFTRLTFPLVPGTGGSAAVRLSAASLSLWSSLRGKAAPVGGGGDRSAIHDDLLLEVDVSRRDDASLGMLSLAVPPGTSRKPYADLLAAGTTGKR